jgi:hypothetical protein
VRTEHSSAGEAPRQHGGLGEQSLAGGAAAGAPPPYTRHLADVCATEARDVAARREVHEPGRHVHGVLPRDLVGLALSGGGVRSASFNLGLLQALFRGGLLKHIDLLATVSGGGYIGSYLASLTQKAGVTLSDKDDSLRQQLVPNPAQPERVARFVRHGKYLNHPGRFFNQYLFGLVFNNLAILSGLAFACMALAWMWRLLDCNLIGGFIYSYLPPAGKWTELWRPFLPAGVFLAAWVFAWGAIYVRSLWTGQRPKTWLTSRLLFIAAACLLVGVAVVLATPVISIPVKTDDQLNEGSVEISGSQRVLSTSIIGLIATALTPLLRPQLLLRIGIHPRSVWERRLFVVVTSALFAGVPFVLVWWFAQHDFSGCDRRQRDRALLMGDINFRTWNQFWDRVRSRHENHDSPNWFIHDKVIQDPVVKKILDDDKQRQKLAALPVPLVSRERVAKQQVINALNNRVIEGPAFAQHLLLKCWRCGRGANQDPERQHVLQVKTQHHPEGGRIRVLIDRLENKDLLPDEEKELNRLLLEVYYPEEILPRTKVYRANIVDVDQSARLVWLGIFFCVFAVAGLVNLNATSLHGFYRDQLAEAFIEEIANNDRTIRLSNLNTASHGAPYCLFAATLNRRPEDRDPSMFTRQTAALSLPGKEVSTLPSPPAAAPLAVEHPGQTPTETFLLSRHYCGSESLGYRRTSCFMNDRLELDDAMAISGAAFSPVQTGNPFIGLLMLMFNMRLGQWLHNPARDPDTARNRLQWTPSVYGVLWDELRHQFGKPNGDLTWHFITDGGHHENLGLWPLLERRCRLIIVSDASQDGDAGFTDLLRLIRRARFERGIRITGMSAAARAASGESEDELVALLKRVRPTERLFVLGPAGEPPQPVPDAPAPPPTARRSFRHFLLARILYPDDPGPSYLVYLKPTLTGDESPELLGYAAYNADFPHSPTADQLYDEDRFESYRQLGDHIGEVLCRELCPEAVGGHGMWDWPLGAEDLMTCRWLAALQEDLLCGPADHEASVATASRSPAAVPAH